MTLKSIVNRVYLSYPDTREASFVHAITAAGITYSLVDGCNSGSIMDCSCHSTPPTYSTDKIGQEYQYYGCQDSVEYAFKKAKEYLDKKSSRNRISTKTLQHNYEAGRLVSVYFIFYLPN